MMSTVTGTLTPRFDLLKPTLDPNDVWGCEINLNFDKIDDAVQSAELVTVSGYLQGNLDTHTSDGTIHFTEGSIDHGSIAGLSDDDHTQYSRADGTRAFTGKVVGVDPTAAQHLTTKTYVDTADTTISGHLQSEIDTLAPLTVQETDGVPTVTSVDTMVFSNGSVTDDGGGQVTIEIAAAGTTANALVGSDGITVTSGDPTDSISGFYTEFVAASGSLQGDIDTNSDHGNLSGLSDDDHAQYTLADGTRDFSGTVGGQEPVVGSDLSTKTYVDDGDAANTAELLTVSGNLQGQIDAVEGSDVDSVNAQTGALTISGTTGVNTSTVGGVITLTSEDSEIDHTSLQNVGANSHVGIDNHMASGTLHFLEGDIDHGSIAGLADDDHTQYSLVDGTRPFTGTVGGITPIADADLSTKLFVTTTSGHLQTGIDAAGAGNITDINAQTGPSITITGAGTVDALTVGNAITISGGITVREFDSDPNLSGIKELVVSTGSLTDLGNGVAQLDFSATGDVVARVEFQQTTAFTEMNFEHGLGEEYVGFTAYDFDGTMLNGVDSVVASGVNHTTVTLDPACSGIFIFDVSRGATGPTGSDGATGPEGPSGGTATGEVKLLVEVFAL